MFIPLAFLQTRTETAMHGYLVYVKQFKEIGPELITNRPHMSHRLVHGFLVYVRQLKIDSTRLTLVTRKTWQCDECSKALPRKMSLIEHTRYVNKEFCLRGLYQDIFMKDRIDISYEKLPYK